MLVVLQLHVCPGRIFLHLAVSHEDVHVVSGLKQADVHILNATMPGCLVAPGAYPTQVSSESVALLHDDTGKVSQDTGGA